MTKQQTDDEERKSEKTNAESSPDVVLAQKVVDALVADGLVCEADGTTLHADLAAGKVDSAKWKLVLENQLERGASDERK